MTKAAWCTHFNNGESLIYQSLQLQFLKNTLEGNRAMDNPNSLYSKPFKERGFSRKSFIRINGSRPLLVSIDQGFGLVKRSDTLP